jgi:hypothetical protein
MASMEFYWSIGNSAVTLHLVAAVLHKAYSARHNFCQHTYFTETNVPPRVEYSLTKRGKALLPVLKVMAEWSKKNPLLKMTDNEENGKTGI